MSEEIRKQNDGKQEAELRSEELANVGGGAIDPIPLRKTGELHETSSDARSKKGPSALNSILEDDGTVHFT